MDSQTMLKKMQDTLYSQLKEASAKLNALKEGHAGPMGLTPDSLKQTPEYQEAKRECDRAFQVVRHFNSRFAKLIRK